MASSLVKIDVHIIFHVKSTGRVINVDDLPRVFSYIGGIVRGQGGIPIAIGGMPDHIHILATQPKDKAVTDFVRTIKKESSKWIKTLGAPYATFVWQAGYGAFSVSPTLLDKTIRYIQSQPQHHKTRSFHDEYKLFLEACGVAYDEQYAFSD